VVLFNYSIGACLASVAGLCVFFAVTPETSGAIMPHLWYAAVVFGLVSIMFCIRAATDQICEAVREKK